MILSILNRTAAVSYDLPRLSKSLDFINVMTYDYHGAWSYFTGVNSPLYGRIEERRKGHPGNLLFASVLLIPQQIVIHLDSRYFALNFPIIFLQMSKVKSKESNL